MKRYKIYVSIKIKEILYILKLLLKIKIECQIST